MGTGRVFLGTACTVPGNAMDLVCVCVCACVCVCGCLVTQTYSGDLYGKVRGVLGTTLKHLSSPKSTLLT